MQSEKHFWVWISLQHSGCRVGNPISLSLTPLRLWNPSEFFLYFNYGHDMKPIAWWSYRVRVKSSLVLLEMFKHPYPTLVATQVLRSHDPCGSDFRTLASAPIQRISVAVLFPTITEANWLTAQIIWCVLLFRQTHPFRLRIDENKFDVGIPKANNLYRYPYESLVMKK